MNLWRPYPADPNDFFSKDEIEKSKNYKRPLDRVSLASGTISTLILLSLIKAGFGHWVIDVTGLTNWPMQLFAILIAFALVADLIGLPAKIWREFKHERAYGFSTTTPGRFAGDQVKQFILSSVILTPLLLIPIWAFIRSTELWWLYGALVLLGISVIMAIIYPIVILPRFNKLSPLEDAELRIRLRELEAKAGVQISEFMVMDASKRTRKDNAFFAGMGATRMVVIFDNMLEMEHSEVGSVIAHEIGHWRLGHIRRSMITSLITQPLLLGGTALIMNWKPALDFAGVDRIGDPAAAPLFLAALGTVFMLTRLVDAWFSRQAERAADVEALQLTGDVSSFMSVFKRMAERDLPELDPSLWSRIKGSHPPIAERLAFAKNWR